MEAPPRIGDMVRMLAGMWGGFVGQLERIEGDEGEVVVTHDNDPLPTLVRLSLADIEVVARSDG